jgi:hypothetical protein
MTAPSADKEALRVLRRLSTKGARLVSTGDGCWRLESAGKTTPNLSSTSIEALRARGLVASDGSNGLILAEIGMRLLRRSLAGGDDFTAQHQDRAVVLLRDENGTRPVTVNQDESPLAWLRRRHDRDGRPHIDAAEFAAGERLRSDYSRGQMMPRVTANWSAAVADGRRGGKGGVAEITEVAIAARRRVERALSAVGPDLAGLLVDFCCFLKGLEEIERERRWPARSAKVVLRLGLAALARHYGLTTEAYGRRGSSPTRHWGTADYRPTID